MQQTEEKAVRFFEEHAGWAYDPAKETPEQGRRKGAELLAKAEQWARSEMVTFGWEEDWDIGSHVEFYGEAYEQEPAMCETCIAYGPAGDVLASLGCIDEADTNYRRVIEAELALEAMTAEPTKPEQPSKEQGYNGWKNYETWAMALWIDNEEPAYRYSRELVREAGLICSRCEEPVELVGDIWCHEDGRKTVCDIEDPAEYDVARPSIPAAADALKDWQEEQMPELEASVWSDLLTAAFGEVDWYEIAENYLSE